MPVPTDWDDTRAKVLLLLAINMFQPVRLVSIKKYVNKHIQESNIRYILDELMTEKKIVRESGHYRLTYKGMQSILPGKGRFIRDIQRMYYLVQSSERGGT